MSEKREYTEEEIKRYEAAYKRLDKILRSDNQEAEEFRRELRSALEKGFPIDFTMESEQKLTLLHSSLINSSNAIFIGIPQILIEAGADVNARTNWAKTALGEACYKYIRCEDNKILSVIDVMLNAGAKPELDKSWKLWSLDDSSVKLLEGYMATYHERKARENMDSYGLLFEYAL